VIGSIQAQEIDVLNYLSIRKIKIESLLKLIYNLHKVSLRCDKYGITNNICG